ncbi:MAG TPA: hypothetical protein VGQ10_09355 [Vicinamibacterales bacterium]|jgi:hypothetical protein|nr:hypothetical protein [Vicinamibacterales bacterium]
MNHPVERGDERRTNERRRSFVEHFLQDGHRLIAAKRQLGGQTFEQNRAHGEEVRTPVDRLAGDLLGAM